MSAFDEPDALDTDRLLNDLYTMRASFELIFDQLARQPAAAWDRRLLNSLLSVHQLMEYYAPSLRRH